MKHIIALLTALTSGAVAVPASADPRYTITDLGTPPTAGSGGSGGAGINASGEVTGYFYTSSGGVRAFLYDGTEMKDLGTLGGNSQGLGINNRGEVTGFFVYSTPTPGYPLYHPFIYDGKTMHDIGTLPAGGVENIGYGINDSGKVSGVSGEFAFLF
jgi:probable HAF family extracellular repeat protein